jgi:hypothetical protein
MSEWLRAVLLAVGTYWVWQVHYVRTATQYPGNAAGDVFGYFLPAYEMIAERLRHGELPFWNPWQGAGVPLLATLQPGALYPPRWLVAVMDPSKAMGVLAIGHVLLGVLAMDRLCRRLGADALSSAIGAIVFGASVVLPRFHNPAQLEPSAWMPVAGLALVALVDGARWSAAVGLGLAVAMPFLAGGYQLAVYVVYGVALLGLALLADRRWRPRLLRPAVLARIAAAAVLAIATALPQALPTLDWSTSSSRQMGALTDQQMFPRFFHLIEIFQALVPQQMLYRDNPMAQWHFSVPVVVLAVVGFVANRALGVVLGMGAVIAYYLMLGPGTPLFVLYRWLPGLAMFRLPMRIFPIIGFAAAIGAALGASRAGGVLRRPALRWTFEAALVVTVVVWLVWPGSNPDHYPWTNPPVHQLPFMDAVPELTGTQRAWLPGDRMDLGFGVYPRLGMRQHLRVLQDYEPLSSRRLGTYLAAVADLPNFDPDPGEPFAGYLIGAAHIARPHLLDLVAVRTIVAPQATVGDVAAIGWSLVRPVWELGLYVNRHALPRAYVTTLVDFAPTETDALAKLLPDEPRVRNGVVLVGSPDDAAPATRSATRDAPVLPARFVRDDPEHLAIAVAPVEPGVLVVADTFADGWTARVDGAPRRVWQANYLVRGVEVAPGDRLVELEYRAPGFRTGLALAAAGWLLVLGAIVVSRRRAA